MLTLTVAEAGVFYMNMVGIENGYAEIVDGGPEVMSASQSMLAGAVSITVEDVTVDEAMGLVTLIMPGVDNSDFSIMADESLRDLSLMQATARSRPRTLWPVTSL